MHLVAFSACDETAVDLDGLFESDNEPVVEQPNRQLVFTEVLIENPIPEEHIAEEAQVSGPIVVDEHCWNCEKANAVCKVKSAIDPTCIRCAKRGLPCNHSRFRKYQIRFRS